MSDTIPRKAMFLVAVIPLIEEIREKPKSTEIVQFLLKQRAGSAVSGPTYKLNVVRFCEGTVGEWLEVRKAISEQWLQNSIDKPQDRVSSVCTVLRGDSLTGFEEKIQELTTSTDENGDITNVALTVEMVELGLNAVAQTVFPHRALKLQKQWMRRRMKKPEDLTIRKTVTAIGRLNNSLPLFPDGSDLDKFTPEEILEILEWSIPDTWRTKFDLDGYIPTEFGKDRFITECEAIERNANQFVKTSAKEPLSGKTPAHKKSQSVKFKNGNSSDDSTKFYCTEHGQNSTHSSDKCFTLKNRLNKEKGTATSALTKKSFRKEINSLAKGRPKKKILEMFASVLQEEAKKIAGKKSTKAKAKKRRADDPSDSDSSDEMSVDNIEHSVRKTDETDEDQTYQDRIDNLGSITNED